MPVIRPSGRSNIVDSFRVRLTALLFKELMGESVYQGPVVFEDPVGVDAINVIVVWEAWQGLAQDDRTSVIREAYARYSGALEQTVPYLDARDKPDLPMVPRLTMALGATGDEVEEHGLLPYSVRPNAGPEAFDADELERIMIEAGAIQTPTAIHLRFPSRVMATEAHARLAHEMPEARWSIHEETDPAEGWSGP
jgi:hypothetical protein